MACFPGDSVIKNPPANAGDVGLIPGSGGSPEEGNGNPFFAREILWTESRTHLSDKARTEGVLCPASQPLVYQNIIKCRKKTDCYTDIYMSAVCKLYLSKVDLKSFFFK